MIAVVLAFVTLALTGWEHVTLPGIVPNAIDALDEGGVPAIRVRSSHSASTLAFRLDADPASRSRLAWRWKVDRVVASADLSRKEGDDFAARVYVSFDVPLEALPFAERTRVRIARLLHGPTVPTAAICYVWDNRHAPGTVAWSPYSRRLRMVVVRSGGAQAGQWVPEARDVAADFREAFGAQWSGPLPRITAIAVGADTDQTGEAVTAWFSGLALEPRR